MGEGCKGWKLWYTLKFDGRVFSQFASHQDVTKLMKGNNDHAYMYVVEQGGLSIAIVCELRKSFSAGAEVRSRGGLGDESTTFDRGEGVKVHPC